MEFPSRKPTRLKNFDYSQDGCYFVTVCSDKRRQIFSSIVGQGLAPAVVRLSLYGEIAKAQLLALDRSYPSVKVEKFVIMPDHIHAIISIDNTAGASPRPTLSDVMCAFKSKASREIHKAGFYGAVFQSSFYEHIIRNDMDYREIWRYIDGNPEKWLEGPEEK